MCVYYWTNFGCPTKAGLAKEGFGAHWMIISETLVVDVNYTIICFGYLKANENMFKDLVPTPYRQWMELSSVYIRAANMFKDLVSYMYIAS